MHLEIKVLAVDRVLWGSVEVEVSGTESLLGAIWESDVELSILQYRAEITKANLNLSWDWEINVALQL